LPEGLKERLFDSGRHDVIAPDVARANLGNERMGDWRSAIERPIGAFCELPGVLLGSGVA